MGRGVLCKVLGGEHSRQREEQSKVPDSCLRDRKQASCWGKRVLESLVLEEEGGEPLWGSGKGETPRGGCVHPAGWGSLPFPSGAWPLKASLETRDLTRNPRSHPQGQALPAGPHCLWGQFNFDPQGIHVLAGLPSLRASSPPGWKEALWFG